MPADATAARPSIDTIWLRLFAALGLAAHHGRRATLVAWPVESAGGAQRVGRGAESLSEADRCAVAQPVTA